MTLQDTISAHAPRLAELRHALHQIPELGYEEFETAKAIRAELDRLKIPYVAGVPEAPTATVAWIGDTSKPCVALRADIDALPIAEQTGLPYASRTPGRMHACGHDGHTTTLLGTAAVLKAMEKDLPVCVKFLWQPAEEGGGGGEILCKAGVIDGRLGPKVSAIFGLHGWPTLKVGTIATKPGSLLAASDNFTVTFTGRGCHGAFPHAGIDPIVTACEAVLNLQQVITRELEPTEPAVITVGKFNAGTATNIIPDTATIEGTARTLSPQARDQVRTAMKRRCEGIAAANGCTATFEWHEGYPPMINDPKMAAYVAKVAKQVVGLDRYYEVPRPSMGGEDFAYYLQEVQGCFFLIGVQPVAASGYPPLHSDRFDFTDEAIATGVRMFVELVLQYGR
ncbi:M20 metallopeptidase family protein [Humisphaera borealis]|uniref:Amidohydrolase n=1 Tax=Humisphaera borealis TaxID=2807512 RepID=A0A7M2WUP4_9BACT|nr:M20 family metallopeptidase [Humisphaera borealis]QOV89247.1 amidohydrolase [Humisphaera borealis]